MHRSIRLIILIAAYTCTELVKPHTAIPNNDTAAQVAIGEMNFDAFCVSVPPYPAKTGNNTRLKKNKPNSQVAIPYSTAISK
ncbi:hypothetical protein AW736_25960 [Termitidicoccus mucosus]|uniref:Uncharacterized protein n=1 Tax=Termitidicoccus mucosus TaxID=1184151 RepID=A0A178IA44_9BACT|nr:hypothetical protein AW736_25960 [Opitutaceae bacterium TSB47]